jgi:predicted outer membrane repeat protein
MIASGGQIWVGPGVYNEAVDFGENNFSIVSTAGAAKTVLDGSGLGQSVVTMSGNQNDSTLLSGFTIRNGQSAAGAGMYISNSSPTIEYVIFENNIASGSNGGGAVYINTGSPTFLVCDFVENSAQYGGATNILDGSPKFDRCRFIENTASRRGGAISGGTPTLPSNFEVASSIFAYNSVPSDPDINNQRGGAISNVGNPTITNCSFGFNSAPTAGGIWITGNDSIASISNSILWSNSSSSSTSQSSQIAVASNSTVTLNYCCVEGLDDSLGGDGNLGSDPLFIANELRVEADSPVIDAGSNEVVPSDDSVDLDGLPRIAGDAVDMGAYESQSISCRADLNQDGNLDFFDVSAFLVYYQLNDPMADFNGDGSFDFFDVSAFLVAFQSGCP